MQENSSWRENLPRKSPEILGHRPLEGTALLREIWSREFSHTHVVQLSPLVRRLTAPNPGFLTGPGTNAYLVGRREMAVIDPGPKHLEHLRRLAEAGQGRIRWVLATHTHPDHSPAAAPLAKETGAQMLGSAAKPFFWGDSTFLPHRALRDGDRLESEEFTLRVIATPGHASNHLCYLLEQENILFAGDQVMEGTTVVVAPPDGSMRQYLASLERLKAEDITAIAPAHGRLIAEPRREFQKIIDHRLEREEQVVSVLEKRQKAQVAEVVQALYSHLPRPLQQVAAFSVQAHLLKLAEEKRIKGPDLGGRWKII